MPPDPFESMAKRVEATIARGDQFGGAAVIVFPQPTGGQPIEAIELLILDPKSDPAQFIATLSTRLKMIAEDLDARARQGFR